jgi:uncharacterized protein YdeI (YjbR/CyaY-like superfamily)
MEITRTFYARDRARWRAWLEKNHAQNSEIWLVFYKKHTGKTGVSYDEALDEALCFGWIDGLVKRIDDEKYAQRFSPRKKNSAWSEGNKKRVQKMIEQGRMTKAGLEKFESAGESKKNWRDELAGDFKIPADVQKAFAAIPKSRENFDRFPPGYRRLCIGWIITAKKPETRQKRIRELVELSAQNKRIGLK